MTDKEKLKILENVVLDFIEGEERRRLEYIESYGIKEWNTDLDIYISKNYRDNTLKSRLYKYYKEHLEDNGVIEEEEVIWNGGEIRNV